MSMTMAVSTSGRTAGAGPHVLMGIDAVGGVWRYAMDLAAGLTRSGYSFTFVGFGPRPSPAQRAEAECIGKLLWLDASLDWLASDKAELNDIPELLRAIVDDQAIDLVHLNLPSQASGLDLDIPVVVVSHSCVVTWFAAVRHTAVPPSWEWQYLLNRQGFDCADIVLAPSHAHAKMLGESYGVIDGLQVVYNATRAVSEPARKEAVVLAAGRWWDDGKNGAILDAAAACAVWPIAMAGPLKGPNMQTTTFHNTRLLGELCHADMARQMARAAIFASPSLYEPFGLAPLEAARAEAALVLSDIATYRELWDGAALFVDPDDATGFADAINRLASDDALRHELAITARARSERYTLDAQVTAMLSVYDNLLHSAAALGA